MSEYLKGNFKAKREIVEPSGAPEHSPAQQLSAELRKKALSSLGGSMVYVDRTDLTWDPDSSPVAADGR